MILTKFTLYNQKFKQIKSSLPTYIFATSGNISKSFPIKNWSSKAMETEEHILRISQGLIKGLKRKTIYDDDYFSFEGIPYGHPPIGNLRFKAPLPAVHWTDVKDCRESNIKPLQKNHSGEIEGSEDCLYLNVYAKTLSAHNKLPVMVYIYGGGYNTGSSIRSKYGPDYFMQENVLLVTFNYRLSSLGFLSLSDPACDVPGNAGLKDQVLALKWVQQNISHFGGDIHNITLFGESAGASSVHFMLATPQTQGLFHKAICMSGCILNSWAFNENNTELAYRLACDKGFNGPNEDSLIIQFLQELPAEQLVQIDNLNLEAAERGVFCAFIPSFEPYDTEGSIIRKNLKAMLKLSWGNNIPMMIGGTSFEGLVRYSGLKSKPQIMDLYKRNPEMLLPVELKSQQPKDILKTLAEQLKSIHLKGSADIMSLMDHASFSLFWHGFHRFIKSRQQFSLAPTYQYLFDFDSPTFNHHRTMFCGEDIKKGVAHADDLSYLWYAFYSWKLEKESPEYFTIKRMVKIWTSFANSSNPNCEYTKDSTWRTVEESDSHHWLRIANELRFEKMPEEFQNKLDVWNSLYGNELF